MPSRNTLISNLKASSVKEFDVLVIGGGCTGSGVALDAASRGLNVACLERDDFASGTSSRSTKLIWGGSRYLVQALISLFSKNLITSPFKTVKRFIEDFKMVLNCHKERRFLLESQPHLTSWLPIAVPLMNWIQWPPPFGYAPAALGPVGLFPIFFKFYDALSGFSCPPSHIMTPARAKRKFPQLANKFIKYSTVFYEGQHDDSRTNLAIALTALQYNASICNYIEVCSLIKDNNNKIKGVLVKDKITNEIFSVYSNIVIFCGGPFTDDLRQMEKADCPNIVTGSTGVHIVLPGYFAPSGIGLVDMSTSDGRFLFFLPWQNHVLVGTTDKETAHISSSPEPLESEIQWILTEATKYLNSDLQIRRQDVLSAWAGIRPLVAESPNPDQGTKTLKASRDHVVSYNEESGSIMVGGGKWTTYREMAEDAVDKALQVLGRPPIPCTTRSIGLLGRQGYSEMLPFQLIQRFNVSLPIASRLAKAYGGKAEDVLNTKDRISGGHCRRVLVDGYPYLEAEVVYAARCEYAQHAEDIIARRTRLAFLNKEAAVAAVPRVVQLMAGELCWDEEQQQREGRQCLEFLDHFGGPTPRQGPRDEPIGHKPEDQAKH